MLSPPSLHRCGDAELAPGGLLDGDGGHRLLDLRRRAVLQHRLAAADLGQRRLPALVVELLEAVEAVVVELLER
jgi:hypothetical protein